MNSYNVGDVLWVVGRERPGLRVFQIVEEVTKKTMQGEITTYMISAPSKNQPAKKFNLSKIDGEIYSSADEAKQSMRANAENAIDQMFAQTSQLVKTYFTLPRQDQVTPQLDEQQNHPSEYEEIVLENGTRARVKLPDAL